MNYDFLYNNFIKDSKNIDISNNIIKKLQTLKKYYIIILINDNMDSFDRWTIPTNKENFIVFDEIFNSYNFGYSKSDFNGKSFTKYIEKYDSQIGNSILIDDSVKNCEIFEKLGGLYNNITGEKEVLKVLNKIINKENL